MPVTEVTHSQRTVLLSRPGAASGGARSHLPAVRHRPHDRPARSRAGHPGHHYAAHLGRPPLRTTGGHSRDERRASWLELFLDLAFAGAVGQLAGALQDHPALGTLARFALLFTPIWWLWVQLTFYADRHESEDAAHRVPFLAAILLCVGLAASAPRALSGSTTGFVIAFACLRGLQLLLYARAWHHLPATRPLYNCYLACFGAGGALWLSSLAVGGPARYAFWGVALLADAVGSMAMLVPRRRVPVNTAHLTDRFQLFVLIVLGESMARLISAAAIRPWSLPLATVLAAALLTLAALWWAWLTAADRQALDGLPAVARFTALNLPLVAGVAAASAGLHLAILAADGAGTIAAGPRAALYGGVSVFLLASAILPSRKMTRPARVARLATASWAPLSSPYTWFRRSPWYWRSGCGPKRALRSSPRCRCCPGAGGRCGRLSPPSCIRSPRMPVDASVAPGNWMVKVPLPKPSEARLAFPDILMVTVPNTPTWP
jgi:low temperature requirement protein LtrA